jgi:isopentenyl diphosphate isomerase/L-lactate dehydrogenase-like FMN-dependent dehydrogenase
LISRSLGFVAIANAESGSRAGAHNRKGKNKFRQAAGRAVYHFVASCVSSQRFKDCFDPESMAEHKLIDFHLVRIFMYYQKA